MRHADQYVDAACASINRIDVMLSAVGSSSLNLAIASAVVVATVNRLLNETLRRHGFDGTVDILRVIGSIRALQAIFRCVVTHKTSPESLIERAEDGDRRAVLDLVKLDPMFCRDSCTKAVLDQAYLRDDRRFIDQMARAQKTVSRFERRDACEAYMLLVGARQLEIPPLREFRFIVDPSGTSFSKVYDFEKCFQRLKSCMARDKRNI